VDENYRPYFFAPHPLRPQTREIIDRLNITPRVEEKRDLFSGQMVKVNRIQLTKVLEPKRVSANFDRAWENDIPTSLKYVYDRDLVFTAKYSIHGNDLTPAYRLPEETKSKFEATFSDIQKKDPDKYALLERWFYYCSQPVPELAPVKLRINEILDREQLYLAFMLSRIANLPISQAYVNSRVSRWIKSILHNYLKRKNILIPTSKELKGDENRRNIRGAITFPPKPGIYFNTVVLDFESLYPSLIDAYNLSYETINCSHDQCQTNQVPSLENHVCRLRRGIYSRLIGSLKDLRIRWFKPLAKQNHLNSTEKMLAQATSQLLKLLLVSSYGVTVRIPGLAKPSLAESITAYGRYTLQTTWNMAKDIGLHPIYGDTDSVFLDDPREEQVAQLITIVKNNLHLDLAVEKQYSVCVLPRAMKAYFGISIDGVPDIKGVTAIKSNSPLFIRNVFFECVKAMGGITSKNDFIEVQENIEKVVRTAISTLKARKIPLAELAYEVKISQDPKEKVNAEIYHQPYQCALQLIDSGQSIKKGDFVTFIKVKPFLYRGKTFTVKPIRNVKDSSEINVEDYVRNLTTALNQTFRLLDITFSDEEQNITLADFL
jgi:DNA polymerase I